MELEQLLAHKHIAIQCHDNPDADAIAAGYGLYAWFKAHGKDVNLFYGGPKGISKPNLIKMLGLLQIPIEHVPERWEWPGLLITADCQYGAGNVSAMGAKEVAVIDHHIIECPPPPLHDIRPYLGSCSTLIWVMLKKAGFEIDTRLATALFYGLFSDTGALAEIRHPLDRDLRDAGNVNGRIIKILRNSNLSLDDLGTASSALKELSFNENGRFALVRAQTGDSNILGFISDLVMQVDNVDTGIVYSEINGGIKYSVRTLERDTKASDIAAWLSAGGLGSGGGHAEKAGGYISLRNFKEFYPGLTPGHYFARRMQEYMAAYTIIDHASPDVTLGLTIDPARSARYEKLPVNLAYVPCAEVFPQRTALHVRMLEGDINIEVDEHTYLMIGLKGEVYPITRARFEASYISQQGRAELEFEYPPVVLEKAHGTRVDLTTVARPCSAIGGALAVAQPLSRGVKLFTRWDNDNYIKGEAGDWLVWREDDPVDMYIITADMFGRLYRPLNAENAPCNPPVTDYSGIDLSTTLGARKVCKKEVTVYASFAHAPGIVTTLEGPVPYAAGDAILTGQGGESWPVSAGYIASSYSPASGVVAGQSGEYISRPINAFALKADSFFTVSTKSGAVLHGLPGDWLLQYNCGDYGIVNNSVFNTNYEFIDQIFVAAP